MIYLTCGLRISSSLELPGLPRVQDTEVVRVGRSANREASTNRSAIRRSPQGVEAIHLHWPRVGRIRVTYRGITIFRKSGASDNLVRTYIVGPALAVLLHLRRLLVLHSSTVEIGGKAVAFMGDSGSGKSTLAFALGQRGHRVLSDDLLALKKGKNHHWMAFSGPSALKLWPDAARVLGVGDSRSERIHSWTTKRTAKLHNNVESCARPLGCIYALNTGSSLRIDKCPPRQQFWSLAQNAYCRTLANAKDAIFYFMQCAQLVRHVSVRQLYRTQNPDKISGLVDLIERDMNS
jgi:hypothetical protein